MKTESAPHVSMFREQMPSLAFGALKTGRGLLLICLGAGSLAPLGIFF